MSDSFELQTMGKMPRENQIRVETPKVMVSLRTTILIAVIFLMIVSTVIITAIYVVHSTTKASHSPTEVEVYSDASKTKQMQMGKELASLALAHLVTSLQLEYVEQMNQIISHTIFQDSKFLLELHNTTKNHILQIYDATENPFEEPEAEIVATYKNPLSNKINKSFATLSHEHTFKRLAGEDWNLANATKEQIKKLYDEKFQVEVLHYEGRDPPEVSLQFHKNITELAIFEGVARKIVPPSSKVYLYLRSFLNERYTKKIKDNNVIGIDFGESYTPWFYYYNGEFNGVAGDSSYIGVEEFKDYPGYELKSLVRYEHETCPIVYDLIEITRCWNSFNTSSDKLFWTFMVKEEPLVSFSKSGIQYSVKDLVSKRLQKVLTDVRSRSYHQLETVNRCVIAVPTDFDVKQRELVLDAGKMAGFQKVSLLDEDIAAALTLQRVHGPWNVAKTIMFIEFNQLNWNLYILQGYQSSYNRIVSKTYNNSEDFVNFCIKEYCQSVQCDKTDLKYDGSIEARIRWRRLYESCEYTIFYFSNDPKRFRYSVSGLSSSVNIYRNNTELAIKEKLKPFIEFVGDNLERVNLTKESIDEIMMGGKYGNLWVIEKVIGEYFNGRNLTTKGDFPDKVSTVAYGTAVKGLEVTAEAIKRSSINCTT